MSFSILSNWQSNSLGGYIDLCRTFCEGIGPLMTIDVIVNIFVIVFCIPFFLYRKRLLVSKSKIKYIIGRGFKKKLWFPIVLCFISLIFLYVWQDYEILWRFLAMLSFYAFLIAYIHIIRKAMLNDTYFDQTPYNFWLQAIMVGLIGGAIIESIFILNIRHDNFLPFGIFSTLLGWIFQDAIKSAIAFFQTNFNDIVHIGDTISIPSKGVNGKITDISLMSVSVRNDDTTFSTFPTSVLLSEHINNKQQMLKGNTYGRCMAKTFTIDIRSIKSIDNQELDNLSQFLDSTGCNVIRLSGSEAPILNIRLYRLYLMHWLMNHEQVSQLPELSVSLGEAGSDGQAMKVCVFLTKVEKQAFAQLQSDITEHIITSMNWFGLQLYQRSSVTRQK